jgi:hypothetical protein
VGTTAASNARVPHCAITSPIAPPATASSRLSASSCRTTRQRPAPSAARIEISRDRPTARESIRFATFAHAIISTNPTAPSSTRKICRTGPRSDTSWKF